MKAKYLRFLVWVLCLCFGAHSALAQCGTAGNGLGGGVNSLFCDSVRGCLIVGGGFQNSGSRSMGHCCSWNDSSYQAMTFNGTSGCSDSVYCFSSIGDTLFVGGAFRMAGGVPCNFIAMWTGNSWSNVGIGFNGNVRALCMYKNHVYASGDFTMSDGKTMNHISMWNGQEWTQVGEGVNGSVGAMCIYNNMLCMGGDFSNTGSLSLNRICSWNGSNFASLGNGFSSGMMGNCRVNSLCVFQGSLYAGGSFDKSGTQSMKNVSMWNGMTWNSVGDVGNNAQSDAVHSMCAFNGCLFVGGSFGRCGSQSANNLSLWSGSKWSNVGTGTNGVVNALAVYRNELFIAGTFTDAAGLAVNNIARYAAVSSVETQDPSLSAASLYPNPASSFVTVSWSQTSDEAITISVVDLMGRIVATKPIATKISGEQSEVLQLHDLATGVYTITIQSPSNRVSKILELIR